MGIFNKLKRASKIEDDTSYWDKKATVLQWQIDNNEKLQESATNEDIYNHAFSKGYNLSWDEISSEMPDSFIELQSHDTTFAISLGILTAFTAKFIDKIGSTKSEKNTGVKSLETRLENLTEKDFDRNNPFDLRDGLNHRKMGHDIFSYTNKDIPGNYVMRDSDGIRRTIAEIVGGSRNDHFSMSQVIKATYGNSTAGSLNNIWNMVAHTVVHMAKDMVTPNGVPLPFTSLLNKYTENAKNTSGYQVSNKLLDNVQNEFSALRASDFSSIAFIRLGYSALYKIKENEWSQYDKNIVKMTKAQMNVVTYTSCILTQMFLYLFQKKDLYSKMDRKTNETDGGTFNWPMFTLIIKNATYVSYMQNKTNNLLLQEQKQLISKIMKGKIIMGQLYNSRNRPYEYDYNNDDDDYISSQQLDLAIQQTPASNEKEMDTQNSLKKLETLKNFAIQTSMKQSDFMDQQLKILNDFNEKWSEDIFDQQYSEHFYINLNLILKEGE